MTIVNSKWSLSHIISKLLHTCTIKKRKDTDRHREVPMVGLPLLVPRTKHIQPHNKIIQLLMQSNISKTLSRPSRLDLMPTLVQTLKSSVKHVQDSDDPVIKHLSLGQMVHTVKSSVKHVQESDDPLSYSTHSSLGQMQWNHQSSTSKTPMTLS